MKQLIYIISIVCLTHYGYGQSDNGRFILVLGTAQDGGYPHLGCTKQCCARAWNHPSEKRYVVSLALVDAGTKKWWLFEATPDIKEQLQYFRELTDSQYNYMPDGIFITHAHIGHYTGLMQLGREVINSKEIPVYVLPKLKTFLESNGPWQQLVSLKNIVLYPLQEDRKIDLPGGSSVVAFKVPHRDEYSETAGYKIITAAKTYLFIPDINKWDSWNKHIIEEVKKVDIAMLDATFFDTTELPGKRLIEVPHPFVTETISLFDTADDATRFKIHFIHFNHTNPLLWDTETQSKLLRKGFHITLQGEQL